MNSEKDKKAFEKFIKNRYKNIKSTSFENEHGKIIPKKLDVPQLTIIPQAEPHSQISDIYLDPQSWYNLGEFIEPLSHQAFLCYGEGFYLASIFCSAICCEYILKFEYFKKIPKTEVNQELNKIGLGDFVKEDYLKKIGLLTKFGKKISYLNTLRNGYFHFNPNKLSKISSKEKSELFDNDIPYHEGFHLPVLAYKAYSTLYELINHFYGTNKETEFFEEAIKDTRDKMNQIAEYAEKQFGFPDKNFEIAYLNKKINAIEQMLKEKDGKKFNQKN